MLEETSHSRAGSVSQAAQPAAEYVRMSTDHQQYSTANQSQAIREYAARHGFWIEKTYEDSGKSGLNLDDRQALKQLIEDVQNGTADFSTILVYDVSRWGRFQDADESAYYEYICKRAGISVRYCAEQFENDGSPVSTIVKGVKRAMAGEYSRELSVKVFAGQRRLIELGYRQGGPAGYGLRRQLIDQNGAAKAELVRGEHKSIQTDRIVLIPGPEQEIETVRFIYDAFVAQGKNEREIADRLNGRGITTDLGRSWTRAMVHQILINEKYIGNNVWNRCSCKLKGRRIHNPPERWIRRDQAFEPVVDEDTFRSAQAIISERCRRYSDEELLDVLRGLLEQHGYLSGIIIDELEVGPSSSIYRARFGSLIRAYELIGFSPERDYRYIEINRALRRMYPHFIAATVHGIEEIGGSVRENMETDLLTVNDEFTASLCLVRSQETITGSHRWKIRFDAGLRPDITVAIRMNQMNSAVLDYYLLPRFEMEAEQVALAEHNGLALDAYRFETLDMLFELAARSQLMEVSYGIGSMH
ncbi:DNA invertase Pin-like site-specific DNA recombinase [Bradyrhizobium sp. R2.2-H]|jgi:DNA invertase Pin-like site-specific DNA recombinase|uniref:recombinase family protein n=1 Tax=unclassified Bradyrhizobium TaxID=2631580 RepID=UPI00104D77D9|nr:MULTISPECIES: recombinase family protein [unclassified Bradyrhizobium]TCU75288.1 DNA invertase Pin-like site-specific DNA recombinase [Bradyrhizobium sp. Y-H1]TCU78056.1 DNA invertase Pin-like site-specific DNA recombinase [Bradyrhizobium sp. R2.2-H]